MSTVGTTVVPEASIQNQIAASVPSQIVLEHEIDISTLKDLEKLGYEDGTDVPEKVRQYFKDTPILIEIAKCESTFRHLNKNGRIIRGKVNSSDIGVMQINEYYHSKEAEKLGIDLYSLEGNMEYAMYLYEKEGTRPWISSSPCWSA